MFDLEEIMVDPEAEVEGHWFDFLGGRLRVAHADNKRFTRALAASLRRADSRNQFAQIDTLLASSDPEAKAKGQQLSAQREKASQREAARHIFLGFEGYSVGGKALKDTEENRFMLLSDPRFRMIKQEVERLAGSGSHWRRVATEARAKNSQTTTAETDGGKSTASGREMSKPVEEDRPSRSTKVKSKTAST